MQALLVIAFFACAFVDWLAVSGQNRRLEYIAKPATLAILLLFATTGSHPSGWLIAAVTFSMLGDVYLMLPSDVFAAGLGAFLLAHLSYIAAFGAASRLRLPWMVVLLVATYPLTRRILAAVRAGSFDKRSPSPDEPAETTPTAPSQAVVLAVATYIVVISLMVGSAFASGGVLASLGALLFLVSDGILAWNRFVYPLRNARLAVIVTYHLGQFALVTALRS